MSKFNRDKNKRLFKRGLLFAVPVLVISMGFVSYASNSGTSSDVWSIPYTSVGNTPLTYSYNVSSIASNNYALNSSENYDLLVQAKNDAEAAANQSSIECADPNTPGGLGEVQKKQLEIERKKDLTSIDIDKIFKYGEKNGCFNALSDFPDLSVNIPTLSGIFDAVKKTLIRYATRKACAVVDEALEGMLGPLKEQLDVISDSGSLDLSGRVNKEIAKQLYEIDPELGRVNQPNTESQDIGVDFKW